MTQTQTLTLTHAELSRVRRGDRLTGIDGRTVSYRVTGPYGPVSGVGTALGIPMERTDNGITLNLYPDTHVERTITIERTVRPVTRTIGGVVFTHTDGEWRADNGRYVIEYTEAGVTTCEFPHPVKLSNGKGYLCPGQESHYYKQWMAADTNSGELDPDFSDSFKDAANTVVTWIRERQS